MRAKKGSAFLNRQSAADTDVEIICIKTSSIFGNRFIYFSQIQNIGCPIFFIKQLLFILFTI